MHKNNKLSRIKVFTNQNYSLYNLSLCYVPHAFSRRYDKVFKKPCFRDFLSFAVHFVDFEKISSTSG